MMSFKHTNFARLAVSLATFSIFLRLDLSYANPEADAKAEHEERKNLCVAQKTEHDPQQAIACTKLLRRTIERIELKHQAHQVILTQKSAIASDAAADDAMKNGGDFRTPAAVTAKMGANDERKARESLSRSINKYELYYKSALKMPCFNELDEFHVAAKEPTCAKSPDLQKEVLIAKKEIPKWRLVEHEMAKAAAELDAIAVKGVQQKGTDGDLVCTTTGVSTMCESKFDQCMATIKDKALCEKQADLRAIGQEFIVPVDDCENKCMPGQVCPAVCSRGIAGKKIPDGDDGKAQGQCMPGDLDCGDFKIPPPAGTRGKVTGLQDPIDVYGTIEPGKIEDLLGGKTGAGTVEYLSERSVLTPHAAGMYQRCVAQMGGGAEALRYCRTKLELPIDYFPPR